MNKIAKNILIILGIILLISGSYLVMIQASKDTVKVDISDKIYTDQEESLVDTEEGPASSVQPNEPPKDDNFFIIEKVKTIYISAFTVMNMVTWFLIIYLIMSKLNKKSPIETFSGRKNQIIFLVVLVALTTVGTVLQTVVTEEYLIEEEEVEKTTKKDDVENGVYVDASEIDLTEYSSNITLSKGGEYTLKGTFANTIRIDADDAVILNLDNVTIKNELTSAIINVGENDLTINLPEGTVNTLTDGGSSEYDGCIYSTGKLVINGSGTLKVYGNQLEGEGIATEANDITINGGNIYVEAVDDGLNAGGDGGTITINDGILYIKGNGDGIDSNKDLIVNGGTIYTTGSSNGGNAGIDTDRGYQINGGEVVVLGSDKLEEPKKSSEQELLYVTLTETPSVGTLITLLNKDDEIITSFEAIETFDTLIISSEKLTSGTYYLYKNGENTGANTNGLYNEGTYKKGDLITEVKIN